MSASTITSKDLTTTERYIIAKKITEKNFRNAEFKVSPFKNAEGYLGEYFRIEVTVSGEGESNKSVRHLFMKTEPAEGAWQTVFMIEDHLFQKEVNFYKDISGLFRKLISSDVYPECFLGVPGKIVLSDATAMGYRPYADGQLSLDLQHAQHAVITLAKFHAASLIYEEQTGRKCPQDFPDSTRESCYKVSSQSWMGFLTTGGEAIAALAPHLSKYKHNSEAIAAIQADVPQIMHKLVDYFKEDTSYRHVICHGDSWPANFLYKYDKYGKPLAAMLIDFQMTRYRPPAIDLMTALYLSLSLSNLKKWRQRLFDVYYDTVAGEMSNAGLDANSVYSRDEFRQTCIYYQIVGLIYALLYFPFSRIGKDRLAKVVSNSESAVQFYFNDRNDHLIESYNTIPIMVEYMDGIVGELYDNFIRTKRGYTEFTQ